MGRVRGGVLAAGWGEELVVGAGDLASGGPAGDGIERDVWSMTEAPAVVAVLEAADRSDDGGLDGRISCWGRGGGWKWTARPPGLAVAAGPDLERSEHKSFRIWTFVGEPAGIGSGADRLSPCFVLC